MTRRVTRGKPARGGWVRLAAAALVLAAAPVMARPGEPPPGAAGAADLAVESLDKRISGVDLEAIADKTELSRIAGQAAIARARLIVHGKSFYKLTRAGLLPVGGGFGALVTHAMHVERARRMLAADLNDARRLSARAEDLDHALERLSRDRIDLATQRQAMDAARIAAQDQLRRQIAFDRAFETSTGAGAEYVAVYGGGASGPLDAPVAGFAAARGRLLFPVVGRADVRPAQRDGADGPGLELRAPAGSIVRAVFAGRVAFADRYGAYGRIVILDHGNHYYTVSANLDELNVKTGEDVGAGDRIGTVGDDGHGAMLYFEVRQGSQTVAPGPWLGL